jgi:hypothetical protein
MVTRFLIHFVSTIPAICITKLIFSSPSKLGFHGYR